MQGLLLFAGSFARTAGPIFVAYLFDTHGPSVMWIMEMIELSITILVWLILYKRMIPLLTKLEMSSGDNLLDENVPLISRGAQKVRTSYLLISRTASPSRSGANYLN